jgi:hypothetical protein
MVETCILDDNQTTAANYAGRKTKEIRNRPANGATRTRLQPVRRTIWEQGAITRPLLQRHRCITRRVAFLAAYRETFSVRAAAQAAGIAETRHHHWLQQDAGYRQAFASVHSEVADNLQDQVLERAVEGWVEPVFYRGRQCGTIRHYSDRLLMLMLKAWTPEKYR